MKRVIAALIMGLGLFIVAAPQAQAHGLDRVIVVHDGRVVRKFRPAYPHWLRAERDFHRWYLHSRHYGYPRLRHPDWRRLYKLYRQDVRYHRHHRHHNRHRHWRAHRHF